MVTIEGDRVEDLATIQFLIDAKLIDLNSYNITPTENVEVTYRLSSGATLLFDNNGRIVGAIN